MNAVSWFAVAMLFIADLGTVSAVELVGVPRVEVKEAAVIIRWTTDVACGSRVRYGIEAGKLSQQAQGEGVGTVHVVPLDGLKLGATYFFSVGTSRKSLAIGTFITSGKPRLTTTDRPGSTSAPVKREAPSTKSIWGNSASLQDHFERHGQDFGAKNPDAYARLSWEFLQRAFDEGLPAKVDDSDGTLRVWDPKTRAFGAYNRDGTTKTYFKPGSADYFERQPGRPVKLKRKE